VAEAVVIRPNGKVETVDLSRIEVLRSVPQITIDWKEVREKGRIALPGQAEN